MKPDPSSFFLKKGEQVLNFRLPQGKFRLLRFDPLLAAPPNGATIRIDRLAFYDQKMRLKMLGDVTQIKILQEAVLGATMRAHSLTLFIPPGSQDSMLSIPIPDDFICGAQVSNEGEFFLDKFCYQKRVTWTDAVVVLLSIFGLMGVALGVSFRSSFKLAALQSDDPPIIGSGVYLRIFLEVPFHFHPRVVCALFGSMEWGRDVGLCQNVGGTIGLA